MTHKGDRLAQCEGREESSRKRERHGRVTRQDELMGGTCLQPEVSPRPERVAEGDPSCPTGRTQPVLRSLSNTMASMMEGQIVYQTGSRNRVPRFSLSLPSSPPPLYSVLPRPPSSPLLHSSQSPRSDGALRFEPRFLFSVS